MANRCLTHAQTHAAIDSPICLCAGKDPSFFGACWQDIVWTPDMVQQAYSRAPRLNIGYKLGPRWGGVIDIEQDSEAAKHKWATFTAAVELPRTPCWPSKRGRHSLFKLAMSQFALLRDAGASSVFKIGELEFRLGNDGGALQSIIPPSTTDKFTREWEVSIFDCPIATLPDVLFSRLLAAVKENPNRQTVAQPKPRPKRFAIRPGDVYNQRATWEQILAPLGWTCVGDYGDVKHWCRFGKTGAVSATTGYCHTDCRPDCLYIFSTAPEIAPFKAHRSYSKFEAHAQIHHGATVNG
jgi:hypothetical protein